MAPHPSPISARILAFASIVLISLLLMSPAQAACNGPVAQRSGPVRLAAAVPDGVVAITFLGHASFLIESPAGVRIVTDYNDAIRAPVTPDIVTMNNAHPTHYSDAVEPGVKYILRGWDPGVIRDVDELLLERTDLLQQVNWVQVG